MPLENAPIRWLIYDSPFVQVRVIGPAATVGGSQSVHDASRGIASCVYVGGPEPEPAEPKMASCLGGPFDGDEQPEPEILLGTTVVRPVLAIRGTGARDRVSAYRWDRRRFIYDPQLTAQMRG